MLTAAADLAIQEDEIVRYQLFTINFNNPIHWCINNMDIRSSQINADDRALHNIPDDTLWQRTNFIREYDHPEGRIDLVTSDGSFALHATPTFLQLAFNNEQLNIQLNWYEVFRRPYESTLYVMDTKTRFMRGASYEDDDKKIVIGLSNEFNILLDADPLLASDDFWRSRVDADESALDIIHLTASSTFKTPGS